MKTIILLIFLSISLNLEAQTEEDIYFTLNLRDHVNEQLFHVEISSQKQFALLGVVKGKKQILSSRYTINEIDFVVRNFDQAVGKVEIYDVEFGDMNSTTTQLKVYIRDKVSSELPPPRYVYNEKKLGVYKTLLDISIHYTANGSEQKSEISASSWFGFGGHICKSRITY